MTGPLYLKWTAKGRFPSYQGGTPIPYRKWTDRVADPILCEQGWHACRWEDAIHHIAAELWVVELDGQIVEGSDKVVAERLRIVRRVRLSDRALRLFAADCAEAVLPIFERAYPNDDRPRLAIQAARDYANGLISAAARDAAGDAARDAAWAAGDAARDARDAHWAARAAAGAAYWAAAWAARDAAGAAAWAARDAAGDAARDGWAAAWAARDAARAAAWAARTANLLGNYAGLNPTDYAHRSTP